MTRDNLKTSWCYTIFLRAVGVSARLFLLFFLSSKMSSTWKTQKGKALTQKKQWIYICTMCFFSLSDLNTSGLLCDCSMKRLGQWLTDSLFQQSCTAVCAYPTPLAGRSIFSVPPEEFVCGEWDPVHYCYTSKTASSFPSPVESFCLLSPCYFPFSLLNRAMDCLLKA